MSSKDRLSKYPSSAVDRLWLLAGESTVGRLILPILIGAGLFAGCAGKNTEPTAGPTSSLVTKTPPRTRPTPTPNDYLHHLMTATPTSPTKEVIQNPKTPTPMPTPDTITSDLIAVIATGGEGKNSPNKLIPLSQVDFGPWIQKSPPPIQALAEAAARTSHGIDRKYGNATGLYPHSFDFLTLASESNAKIKLNWPFVTTSKPVELSNQNNKLEIPHGSHVQIVGQFEKNILIAYNVSDPKSMSGQRLYFALVSINQLRTIFESSSNSKTKVSILESNGTTYVVFVRKNKTTYVPINKFGPGLESELVKDPQHIIDLNPSQLTPTPTETPTPVPGYTIAGRRYPIIAKADRVSGPVDKIDDPDLYHAQTYLPTQLSLFHDPIGRDLAGYVIKGATGQTEIVVIARWDFHQNQWLDINDQTPLTLYRVNTDSLNVRAKPAGAKVAVLRKGDIVLPISKVVPIHDKNGTVWLEIMGPDGKPVWTAMTYKKQSLLVTVNSNQEIKIDRAVDRVSLNFPNSSENERVRQALKNTILYAPPRPTINDIDSSFREYWQKKYPDINLKETLADMPYDLVENLKMIEYIGPLNSCSLTCWTVPHFSSNSGFIELDKIQFHPASLKAVPSRDIYLEAGLYKEVLSVALANYFFRQGVSNRPIQPGGPGRISVAVENLSNYLDSLYFKDNANRVPPIDQPSYQKEIAFYRNVASRLQSAFTVNPGSN